MSDKKSRDTPGDPSTGSGASRGRNPLFRFSASEAYESIPELLRRLAEESSRLAEQQLKLVEAEVHSAVGDLKKSVGAMAGAAILGITGLAVLLMGLAFLLAKALPLWLASLIVAGVTLAGAYVLFVGGQKKLQSSSLTAERTRRTLERAPRAISGETTEERQK